MKKPRFSISVLNWNGKHLLKKSIESALAQTYRPIEVILVDNGSTDGSVEFVKKLFGKKVEVIALKENQGYSRGHNIGFQRSRGKWTALMSNDVILDKNWVSEVMKTVSSEAKAGVIGSHGYYTNKTEPVNGNYFDLIGIVAPCRNKWATSLMTVAGGVFAVNKALFDKPYDDDYFIYGDESFLGIRNLLKRNTNRICLSSSYTFQGSGSEGTSRLGKRAVFLSERNNLLNFFRFLKLKTILLLLPIFIAQNFGKMVKLFLTGKWDYLKWRLQAWLWLASNIGTILKKRRESQSERKTGDRAIFELFTSASPSEFSENKIMLKIVQKYVQLIYGVI